MGVLNMMLNIMPYHCTYCIQGFKGMVHVSDEARLKELDLIELQSYDAVKEPVWDTLEANDVIFVNGFGHGNTGIYTGDDGQAIFTDEECGILAGRVVYLLSCLTAVALGPAVIAAGGITYIGFDISWTWIAQNITADPYDDWYAEGFYRATNECPIALIQGDMVSAAKDRSIAKYNEWIEIWETERSGDPLAAQVIGWLIYDRDGLTVLGDQSATIVSLIKVSTNSATSITAEVAALNSTLDDDDGEPCDCGFEWGLTPAYGNTTPTQSRTTGQTASQVITGLSPVTTYHFRAFATNSKGTAYGADRTFTTLVAVPTVTTNPATGMCTVNGTLDDNGGETCDCGFEWGETEAYGNTTPAQSKNSGEPFSQDLDGLLPGVTYHFRAFATNSAGTGYGADGSFTIEGCIIGEDGKAYRVQSLILGTTELSGSEILVALEMKVDGVVNRVYEEDFNRSPGHDPPGLWIVNGTLGIHEALLVKLKSKDPADDGKAVRYDYILEPAGGG